MTAALLPRLRAVGADAVIRADKVVLTHASRVPSDLLQEIRARRADLLDELANDNAEPGDRPFVNDPVERAAIQAEAMPVQRIRKRMVSWTRPDDVPQQGDYCGCCSGSLFWSDTYLPRGWCCTQCHPPVHLQAGQFRVMAT